MVWGADLSGLPESLRFRQNCSICDLPPPQIDEPGPCTEGHYLWGGPFKIHFGHLMVDTLPRLWAWNPKRYDGVVFSALKGDKPIKSWVIPMLERIGLDEQYITILAEPATFESVDYALPGSALGEGPTGWYLSLLGKKSCFPHIRQGSPAGDKLYFSRCHIRGRGGLMGESWFESRLRQNGFTILQPEALAIEDQVQALQAADIVVYAEGSSIYSLELIPRVNAKIYMLPRRGKKANGLFEPHIYPRAKYFARLGCDPIHRMPNLAGRVGPSSPSFYLDPEKAWRSFQSEGIDIGSFNRDEFMQCQYDDLKAYCSNNEEMTQRILDDLPSLK